MTAQEQKALDDIAQYGCHILTVFDDKGLVPDFAYSIGLFKNYKHPEIIIYGLPKQSMNDILNYTAGMIKQGSSFKDEQPYSEILDGFLCWSIPVNTKYYEDHFGWGHWLYKDWNFPVVQLVWPNQHGVFPWEAVASDDFKVAQPILR